MTLLDIALHEEAKVGKLINSFVDESLILEKYFDNIFENQLAKTAFIGQIGTYTKFDLTPLDIQYSQEEHEFRIVCLNEELDELHTANEENNKYEIIDAIVDYLIFTVGTAYRADYIVETAICLPIDIKNEAYLLAQDIIYNNGGDVYSSFFDINKKYVEELESLDYILDKDEYVVTLSKMVSSSLVMLEYIDNPEKEMKQYYERVLYANNSKQIGGNSKRGSFAIDLVKPEGWKAPSFEGLNF